MSTYWSHHFGQLSMLAHVSFVVLDSVRLTAHYSDALAILTRSSRFLALRSLNVSSEHLVYFCGATELHLKLLNCCTCLYLVGVIRQAHPLR